MNEIDKLSTEEILQLQEKELRKTLVYLSDNSPYYQKLFRENNIIIDEIKTINDLQKIPVTSKDNLQNRNWEFLCVPKNKIKEYCTTSGTLGMPVTIALSGKDLDRLAYNEYLSFTCAGINENDLFQFMLSLDRQFMAGLAYYLGARKLGAGIARIGPGNISGQLNNILHIQPTVLIAVTSFIIQLIQFADENNIDLNSTSVKKIICIGENLRNTEFSMNSLGKRISEKWNVQLFSTYASTEMQTAFTECEHGNGGHHHPELLIFEVLDEENNQLPEGEFGELTITNLGVEGMPLLRYKTGDICTYYSSKCQCGRTSMRISPIAGRKQQLIKFKGTTIYPQAIFNLLNGIKEVKDYVLQLKKNEFETDCLTIHLALTKQDEQTDKKIKQQLQTALRVLPEINYLSIEEIQKMQSINGQRKFSKLFDERNNN